MLFSQCERELWPCYFIQFIPSEHLTLRLRLILSIYLYVRVLVCAAQFSINKHKIYFVFWYKTWFFFLIIIFLSCVNIIISKRHYVYRNVVQNMINDDFMCNPYLLIHTENISYNLKVDIFCFLYLNIVKFHFWWKPFNIVCSKFK